MRTWGRFDISSKGKWGRRAAAQLIAFGLLALLAGCGGGGGGGGGSTVNVKGTVLQAENNQPPNPAATITINGQSTTSSTTDGTFMLANVPVSAKKATIAATGSQTLTLPLTLSTNSSNTDDLGSIFLSATGYTANVNGRVVTEINNQAKPVGGATVTIAGVSVTSGTDGTFQISNLAVGLGTDPNVPVGTITATGFNAKPILLQFPLVAGNNPIGDQLLGSPISGTTPTQPYTITGQVKHGGNPATGTSVALAVVTSSGNQTLGSTTTDANGNYFFWVVPGTYVVIVATGNNGQEVTSAPFQLASTNTPVTVGTITF